MFGCCQSRRTEEQQNVGRGLYMPWHSFEKIVDTIYIIDILTCRSEVLCRLCRVQIQPSKLVVDYADYTAPTRKHELDHTDHTDHTDQESICLAWQI